MQNNIFLYKFYYQWWKNIDKSIFLIISLVIALVPSALDNKIELLYRNYEFK